ncbi:membrane protein, partial [Streptomyces sp. SPB074]
MVNPPGGSRPVPSAAPSDATDAGRAAGALLLCRAAPGEVAPVARLLRRPLLLCPAGEPAPDGEARWSALVPEDKPWLQGGEPVDRVLAGWATALAVGASWPVLALWWDHERAGLVLCSGFRRPVGYEWAADGTPLGEDEAMRTFVLRLGLDPVLDLQELGPLTREDPESDARARLPACSRCSRAPERPPPGSCPANR